MERKKVIFGLILIAIGIILLGRSLDLFYVTFGQIWRFLLPLGLIALGAWLMVRKKLHRDRGQQAEPSVEAFYQSNVSGSSHGTFRQAGTSASAGTTPQSQAFAAPSGAEPETVRPAVGEKGGSLKYSKFVGDLDIDCCNLTVQNVEVSGGIGDIGVRLHNCCLSPGLNRMIISGFIGDIRVYLPQRMPFFIHCSNFVGDIDAAGHRASGLSNSVENQSSDYERADAKLYIAANNFVGDIKVFVG
ncbi:MAG TPA: cell wall-active antibiotics response protein LiaF [Candidatus Deferrimicrobium sp.]|nr:cell wall-active antibiotics response protein LiaF [Candidatus Deferrimicrobium sp.]